MISIKGKVYLVGAGPGSPELLTVKAQSLIKKADSIIYDRLVSPEILKLARKDASLIFVGKKPKHHILEQEEINSLIAREAENKELIVRLKGGDPFILGRGGEEARELKRLGIGFEIVPGVTSALSVPEAAGIPITDREVSSSFTVVTGHSAKNKKKLQYDFTKADADTLIILMGLGNLDLIVRELLTRRDPQTPVAVIEQGTTERENVVIGNLKNISEKVKSERVRPPAVIVVGDVVRLRREIMD